MMDEATRAAFVAHVKELERRAPFDEDAAKSLACMALLTEGYRPHDDPDGGEVIDFTRYRMAA